MRTIVILLVSLLVGCGEIEYKYTKLTCESGLKTPWINIFHYSLSENGLLMYKHGDKWVYTAIIQGDKCVQTFKRSLPGKVNG